MRTGPAVRTRAFTLAELVGVLTVLAVLAATAIPAVRMLGDTRSAEVRVRLEDALRQARAAAVGRGIPCGVRIDRKAQTVSLLALEAAKAAPMSDAFGQPLPALPIDAGRSVGVKRVTGGSKAGNTPEIWFDRSGSHARISKAGVVTVLRGDATILLTTGETIVVTGNTGMIE